MTRLRDRGITQLEILISLIVMAMIGVLLGSTLDFNRQTLSVAAHKSLKTDLYIRRVALRDWIEGIPTDYQGHEASDVFSGDNQSLTFRTSLQNSENGETGFAWVHLNVQGNQPNSNLVARVRFERNSEGESNRTHLLAEQVSYLKLTYYGRPAPTQQNDWFDHWNDSENLPRLVKIEWETRNGVPNPPIVALPAKTERQKIMSLSSLVPPG